MPSESLNLYLKCAQDVKNYIGYLSRRDSSLDTAQDLKNCKELFHELFAKVKKLTEAGVTTSPNPPDNIIFKYAMKIGEQAASKELIHLYEKSYSLYYTSICLLKYLKRRPCDTIDPTLLNNCI